MAGPKDGSSSSATATIMRLTKLVIQYAHSSLRHRVHDKQTFGATRATSKPRQQERGTTVADKFLELLAKAAPLLPDEPVCAAQYSDTQTSTSIFYATEEVGRLPHESIKDITLYDQRPHRPESRSRKIDVSEGKLKDAFRI